METKIDFIIDTNTVQSEFDRLFSQYQLHFIKKKIILFFKLNTEINEKDFSHSHMHFLLTEIIDGLQIDGYTRVPNNRSIETRVKYFQNRGILKDISFLCIGAITLVASVAIVQGERGTFWLSLGVVIMMLWLFLFMQSFLSLTKYGLKSIKSPKK